MNLIFSDQMNHLLPFDPFWIHSLIKKTKSKKRSNFDRSRPVKKKQKRFIWLLKSWRNCDCLMLLVLMGIQQIKMREGCPKNRGEIQIPQEWSSRSSVLTLRTSTRPVSNLCGGALTFGTTSFFRRWAP